jgi:hypothetical protein
VSAVEPISSGGWAVSEGRGLGLAARGESPAAFGRRCIPPGGVAPRSNTPGILTRRALPSGRIATLGATPDFHHGLLRKSDLAKPFVGFTSPDSARTLNGSVECRTVSDTMVPPTLAPTLLEGEPRKASLRYAEPKLFRPDRSECLRESARRASGIRQPL